MLESQHRRAGQLLHRFTARERERECGRERERAVEQAMLFHHRQTWKLANRFLRSFSAFVPLSHLLCFFFSLCTFASSFFIQNVNILPIFFSKKGIHFIKREIPSETWTECKRNLATFTNSIKGFNTLRKLSFCLLAIFMFSRRLSPPNSAEITEIYMHRLSLWPLGIISSLANVSNWK